MDDEIVGRKLGYLTIVKFLGYRNLKYQPGFVPQPPRYDSQKWYLCRCECGTEIEIEEHRFLHSGTVRTCRTDACTKRWKHERLVNGHAHNWAGVGKVSGSYWAHVRKRAKEKNLSLDITIQEACKKFEAQEELCALSGLPIDFETETTATASLDRIDSRIGYTIENSQWLHQDVNLIKTWFSTDYFVMMCGLVARQLDPESITFNFEAFKARKAEQVPKIDQELAYQERFKHLLDSVSTSTGMLSYKHDILGRVSGELTAIGWLGGVRKGGRGRISVYWKFRCSCGRFTVVEQRDFETRHTVSCGDHITHKQKRWLAAGEIPARCWVELTVNAASRDLKFPITKEQLLELFIQQNRRCALTGLELTFNRSATIRNGNASLDRINSSEGYTLGNVQWVHKDINIMKLDFDESRFKELCCMIWSKSGYLLDIEEAIRFRMENSKHSLIKSRKSALEVKPPTPTEEPLIPSAA